MLLLHLCNGYCFCRIRHESVSTMCEMCTGVHMQAWNYIQHFHTVLVRHTSIHVKARQSSPQPADKDMTFDVQLSTSFTNSCTPFFTASSMKSDKSQGCESPACNKPTNLFISLLATQTRQLDWQSDRDHEPGLTILQCCFTWIVLSLNGQVEEHCSRVWYYKIWQCTIFIDRCHPGQVTNTECNNATQIIM